MSYSSFSPTTTDGLVQSSPQQNQRFSRRNSFFDYVSTRVRPKTARIVPTHPVHVINNFHTAAELLDTQTPPFVICDIDETVITAKPYEYYVKLAMERIKKNDILSTHRLKTMDYAHMLQETEYTTANGVIPIDSDGFHAFLSKIENAGGQLVFLTARCKISEPTTYAHLSAIGIDPSKYDVYYTNNLISKGEYIMRYLRPRYLQQLSSNNVYFIDDQPGFIDSVNKFVPNARCMRFEK